MRKLHLKSLERLVGLMPILSEREQSVFIGGGTGSEFNPYTYDEYQSLLSDGVWNGGFVQINNSGINSSTEYISSSLDGTSMIGGNQSVSTLNSFMNCETPNSTTCSLTGGTGVVDVSGLVNCDCNSGCIEDCICDSGCIECALGSGCIDCTHESTGSVNVTISSSGTITDKSRNILLSLEYNGTINITSTMRTPEHQAQVMLNNIKLTGVQKQLDLYGSYGDQVINVYNPSLSDADNLSAMVNKIYEIGPSKVSKHCGDQSVIDVFDVSCNGLDVTKFKNALSKIQGVKYIDESGSNNCIHIEITQ